MSVNAYNTIKDIFNQAANAFNDVYEALNVRPIGIVTKNYGFVEDTLNRNIGNWTLNSQEGFYTPIGHLADIEYTSWQNAENTPYFLGNDRRRYYDYIDYIEQTFYNGNGSIKTLATNGVTEMTPQQLLDENNKVGVINHLDQLTMPAVFSSTNTELSLINPNGSFYDTRLGILSDYYMRNTLIAGEIKAKELGYSTFQTQVDDTNTSQGGNSITKGVYSMFGVQGHFGLLGNGDETILQDQAVPNRVLTGDIIPWSTTDHVYDTSLFTTDRGVNNNTTRVALIQGGLPNQYSLNFNDLAQGSSLSNIYSPFGNYYSITYSLGLIANSGSKTQKYIAASMLGKPLSEATDIDVELLNGENYKPSGTRGSRYYVGNGTRGTNYIDQMTSSSVEFVKQITWTTNSDGVEVRSTPNQNVVRLKLNDAGNDNMFAARAIYEHLEAEGNEVLVEPKINFTNFNRGVAQGNYLQYDLNTIRTKPDIINKTNELFRTNQIKTIIGRFHTDEFESKTAARANVDYTSTAISKYGMSRGRNLLKRNHSGIKDNDYTNPYCRVWTYHHQYSTLNDTMRPFENRDAMVNSEIARYRRPATTSASGSWDDGQTRLNKLSARIKSNGLVRISPTNPNQDNGETVKEQLKHLMFSIENLAWVGETSNLDEDQKGPLGGRIMWFPPYNLQFNENVTTNWNEVEFIGRGEKIPTYINTNRGGTLSFDILIDHPSVVNSFSDGMYGDGIGDVDDVDSTEQTLLRFFAGCELLAPTTQTVVNNEAENNTSTVQPHNTVIIGEDEEEAFSFFVFFPNNYSGVDDRDRTITTVGGLDTHSSYPLSSYFPFRYLITGVGSGYAKMRPIGSGQDDIPDAEAKLYDNIVGGVLSACNGYEISQDDGLNFDFKTPDKFDEYGSKLAPMFESYVAPTALKWGYRIDNVYNGQRIIESNRVDNTSFMLNHRNGVDIAKKQYGIVNTDTCFSLFDTFVAFTKHSYWNYLDGSHYVKKEGTDEEVEIEDIPYTKEQEQLIKILEELETNPKVRVVINGYASQHGRNSLNNTLAYNRAVTIKEWMKKHSLFNDDNIELGVIEESNIKVDENVNLVTAKLGRAALVQVFKAKEMVTTPADVIQDIITDNINVKDNNTERNIQQAQGTYLENIDNAIDQTAYNIHMLKKAAFDGDTLYQRVATNIEAWSRDLMQKKEENKYLSEPRHYNDTVNMNGYRNEYKFFNDLKRSDPFLHDKITHKFKFFDPAFHSITPEGYQSRLTFLQQCTRQGNTLAWSDTSNARSAANLAFGRPPILVLRIGDFYNTKIVLTSLNIDYKNSDNIQWDLNDEGIGIMPMYAHISINFNFYGGSDLGGPVSRLQNALSFNYYANTSVYDERAEMVEYDENGKLSRMKVNKEQ